MLRLKHFPKGKRHGNVLDNSSSVGSNSLIGSELRKDFIQVGSLLFLLPEHK